MASVLSLTFLVVTMLILELVVSGPVDTPRKNPCLCYAQGDPHYKSCDNLRYDFQGKCEYLFSELCTVDKALVYFKVAQKNEICGRSTPKRQLTCVREVTLMVHKHKIEIFKSGSFRVDGVDEVDEWTNPEYSDNQHLKVFRVGPRVVVKTDFGLRLSFSYARLRLRVPPAYAGKLCGLCGNFNGDKDDDFTSEGTNYAERYQMPAFKNKAANDFGNALLISDPTSSDDQCRGECLPSGESGDCEGEDLENAEAACKPLKDPSGPFQDCVNGMTPLEIEEVYNECLFDMCRDGEKCTVYKNFDDHCRESQFESPTWRGDLNCPLNCGKYATYNYSVTPCPNTCRNPNAQADCDEDLEDVEGCVCKEGYLVEDGACIKKDKCGCRTSCGQYYKRDKKILTSNCKFEIHCKGSGEICEKPFECKYDCFMADGKWQCEKPNK